MTPTAKHGVINYTGWAGAGRRWGGGGGEEGLEGGPTEARRKEVGRAEARRGGRRWTRGGTGCDAKQA